MPQIEIDFDVYKELTSRRPAEAVSYNDVIRSLLRLSPIAKNDRPSSRDSKAWILGDTSFPIGTEFLAKYKDRIYTGTVKDGKLALSDGHAFTTPSAAAIHITGSNVNGWRFWRVRLPEATQYVLIERLRGKFH